MSARAVCNVTSAAWRPGCKGMVRPPVFPLLARFGTWSTSATCPCASVTMAQVSEAIALARRPAFIDRRKQDPGARRMAGGGQGAQHGPLLGQADNLRLLPLHGGPPIASVFPSYTVTSLLHKNATSLWSGQVKWSIRPASRLHCTTKNDLLYRVTVDTRQHCTDNAEGERPPNISILATLRLCTVGKLSANC
jgi:hypothetical protein